MARTKQFEEEEIVEKSMQLFWCKGYNATSVQDLVENLGINRASMYDTFTDKHTLYVRSLRRYRQTHSSVMLDMFRQDRPVVEILNCLYDLVIGQGVADAEHKGCFLVNATTELAHEDGAVAEIVNSNRAEIEQAMAAAFAKAQTRGEIADGFSPQALAQFFFSSVSGLQLLVRSQADLATMNNVRTVALAVLEKTNKTA